MVTHSKKEYCVGSSEGEESVLSFSEKAVLAGSCKPVTTKPEIDPTLESSEGSLDKGDEILETTEEVGEGIIDTAVQGDSTLPNGEEAESGL